MGLELAPETPRAASVVWAAAPDRLKTIRVRRSVILVLAVALVARIVILFAVRDVGIAIDDEKDYHALATSLANGQGYQLPSLGTTSIRPPLYPAFIAGVWRITGNRSLASIRVAQIGLSLISVVLVWAIARRLYGDQVALIAAAIWGLYPSFLYAGSLILTEVLFTTLLMAALWFGIESLRSGRVRHAALMGICLGLGALTRSVLWPFPAVLAALGLIVFHRRYGLRKAAVLIFVMLSGYIAMVGPWSLRNTRLQHTFTVVDTMGGLNLRMGNFEYTLEDRMWDGVSLKGNKAWAHQMFVEHPDAGSWTEGQKEKWAQQAAIAYMREHPLTTLRRSVLKFGDFWGLEREYVAALKNGLYHPPGWFAIASAAAVFLVYPVVMLLAWLGVIRNTASDVPLHGLLLLTVLFICGIHSLVFGHSRYHLPVMAILAVYAAAAVAHRSWRELRGRELALFTSGTIVLAAFWARELLVRDSARLMQLLGVA